MKGGRKCQEIRGGKLRWSCLYLPYVACVAVRTGRAVMRTEYIYGDSIEEDHGAYDNIVQLVYINAVDGSCVDIIETAKCLETWYGTDPETGAGTKTISK